MVAQSGDTALAPAPTPWWRMLLYGLLIAAVIVIVFLLFERYFRSAATVLLLAAVLTYLLQPVVEWAVRATRLRRAHAVRVAAVLIIYLLIAGVLVGMGTAIVGTIKAQATELYTTFTQGKLPAQVEQLQAWYLAHVPAEVRAQIAADLQRELQKSEFTGQLAAWTLGMVEHIGKWAGLIVELIFVPLIAFYFLTDSRAVREQVLFFVPGQFRERVLRYGGGMDRIFRRYIQGQIVLVVIAWAVVTIGMIALGVPGALLLGVIAGLARAIPVIGPVIGGVPRSGAVLLHPHTAGYFWPVLIGFTSLHLFESKYLMPRILGDHLGIHPIIIIISLIVGYEFLGLLGMFIAPPVVAIIRFILAMRRGEGPFAAPDQPALPGLVDDAKEAVAQHA